MYVCLLVRLLRVEAQTTCLHDGGWCPSQPKEHTVLVDLGLRGNWTPLKAVFVVILMYDSLRNCYSGSKENENA